MTGVRTSTIEAAEPVWRSHIQPIVIPRMRLMKKMRLSYMLEQSFRVYESRKYLFPHENGDESEQDGMYFV